MHFLGNPKRTIDLTIYNKTKLDNIGYIFYPNIYLNARKGALTSNASSKILLALLVDRMQTKINME